MPGELMATKRKATPKSMLRMSVGFPREVYRTLEQIAARQRVSVAWVVRDAVEKYVDGQWPLLSSPKG